MQKKDRSLWGRSFFLSLAGGAVERERIPHRGTEGTENVSHGGHREHGVFFYFELRLCGLCGLCEEFVIFCTTYSF